MFLVQPAHGSLTFMGPEIGAANGKSVRYRGFLPGRPAGWPSTGFNPSAPSGFRQAVVYRQRIQ